MQRTIWPGLTGQAFLTKSLAQRGHTEMHVEAKADTAIWVQGTVRKPYEMLHLVAH